MTVQLNSEVKTRLVLDKGYVRLVDHMGSDLSVVNAARASFAKESKELDQKDARLISFLIREGHFSTLRHAFVTYEFKAPLMVARQHWKYIVGSDHTMDGWNEACFPGDQEIVAYPYTSGIRKKYSISQLYDLAQKNRTYLPRVVSIDSNGELRPNKIKDVWYVGEHEVFEVTVSTGAKIKTTGNHRYLTPSGYIQLNNLNVGDYVMGNGKPAYKDRDWLEKQYVEIGLTQQEIADRANCSVHTIRKWVRMHSLQQDQVSRLQAHNRKHGAFGKGLTKYTSEVIAERSLKSAASQKNVPKSRGELNGNYRYDNVTDPSTGRYRARRINQQDSCEVCGDLAQIHHIDENPFNNDKENLIALCQGHHGIAHGKNPLLVSHPVQIVEIVSLGTQKVYDVEMVDEPNLVVSNVIVHNSRRYITSDEEFYIPKPDEWRSAPEDKKQGSGGPVPTDIGSIAFQMLMDDVERQVSHYRWALESGICAEQARLFLPAYGLYINYRWSASLQSLTHFLSQRLEHDAQKEIQDYAQAVRSLTEPLFPITFQSFGF